MTLAAVCSGAAGSPSSGILLSHAGLRQDPGPAEASHLTVLQLPSGLPWRGGERACIVCFLCSSEDWLGEGMSSYCQLSP